MRSSRCLLCLEWIWLELWRRLAWGSTGFRVGDEVYGMTGGVGGSQGSLAEFAAVDAKLLAKKPANVSMRQAAAIPLSFITAWEGVVDRANVRAGQKALVHAGAGGVGHVVVQIAKARGAEVFATVSEEKKAIVEGYGAVPIDYRSMKVEEYVAEFAGGEGFDVIYDTVGGATLDDSFAAAKIYTGHVVSCLGWGTHRLAPLSFRGATYSGVFTLLPLLTGKGREHHGEMMREATRLVEAGSWCRWWMSGGLRWRRRWRRMRWWRVGRRWGRLWWRLRGSCGEFCAKTRASLPIADFSDGVSVQWVHWRVRWRFSSNRK